MIIKANYPAEPPQIGRLMETHRKLKKRRRGKVGGGVPPNEPEVDTYITGLATPLSAGQITLLNTFVATLKSGLSITSLSDAFDCLWIFAGETQENSLKNLVKNAHHCTSPAMPTFTALEGFTGNDTTMYLDCNWNGRTAGHAVALSLNSASFGIYFRTNVVTLGNKVDGVYSSAADGGTSNRIHLQRAVSVLPVSNDYSLNSNLATSSVTATKLGMYITSRTGANTLRHYINKTDITVTSIIASTKIPDQGLVLLARRTTTGAIGLFDPNQAAMSFLGKGLTSGNVDTITDAFEAYMDANGKGVI